MANALWSAKTRQNGPLGPWRQGFGCDPEVAPENQLLQALQGLQKMLFWATPTGSR